MSDFCITNALPDLKWNLFWTYIKYSWQIDEELDELISRIQLHEGDTEFWKARFLGEGFNENQSNIIEMEPTEVSDMLDDADAADDGTKDVEDDEADEEDEVDVEVEVEQTENQVEQIVKEKEAESKKPLQMIGVQLLKDSDQTTTTTTKKSRRRARASMEVRLFIQLHLLSSIQEF